MLLIGSLIEFRFQRRYSQDFIFVFRNAKILTIRVPDGNSGAIFVIAGHKFAAL